VHVLQLQGYLFFGTAHALLGDAKLRLSGAARARFVVLDFARVQGLDSSAVQSFQRLRAMAASAGATLVLTDLPRAVEQMLVRGHVLEESSPIRVSPDLDRGLELCENALIAENEAYSLDSGAIARERASRDRLARLVAAMAGHAERVEVEPGDEVYQAGSPAGDLVLVETGELSAFTTVGEREKRLRVMGSGSIVGEIGLYLGQARTATVRATRPSVLHRLGRAGLERLAHEAPGRAVLVHQAIATALAERLAHATTPARAWFR
jgi:SulP family sulfate permease